MTERERERCQSGVLSTAAFQCQCDSLIVDCFKRIALSLRGQFGVESNLTDWILLISSVQSISWCSLRSLGIFTFCYRARCACDHCTRPLPYTPCQDEEGNT